MHRIDFEAVFGASPNPYVLLDRAFVILGMNDAYLATTGRRREALVGRGMFDAFPSDPGSDSHRRLRRSLERVVESGVRDELAFIHYAIPRPEGGFDDRYWSATHTPLFKDGAVAFILQHTVDVTELHRLRMLAEEVGTSEQVETDILRRAEAVQQANEALFERSSQLEAMFQQAPGFIAVLEGPDHVFSMANAAYDQLIGHRLRIGAPVSEILPEVVEQGFTTLLDDVYQSGKPFLGQGLSVHLQPMPDAEPEERFVDFVYQPIFGRDGAVTGIFVQGHDVTEQKSAERALRLLNETLEARVAAEIAERQQAEVALHQARKMESIGKLTGGVAHDFNNLLQVVSGNLQLLGGDVRGNARAERRIANALAGVERGAKLAAQLLAFGRRQPLAPKVVNIGRFVHGMEDMLRRSLGEAIAIDMRVSDRLWNSFVDPNQVENALLNLAINARDAMDGAGTLVIAADNACIADSTDAELAAGDYVTLAVADTGSGMSAEVIAQVFEPFFSTKAEGKGTGLGLSMVYGFAKQSGGHVRIESTPGAGTIVTLFLPRALGDEEAASTPAVPAPMEGGSETILVAEDDAAVRDTAVELLRELGYRVLIAEDAAAALALIEQGAAVDLLFTDVVMPGPLASPDLARLARDTLPDLAVLFTSGYTQDAIVHGGRLDEGVHLLSKPYTREALARRVRSVLDAR